MQKKKENYMKNKCMGLYLHEKVGNVLVLTSVKSLMSLLIDLSNLHGQVDAYVDKCPLTPFISLFLSYPCIGPNPRLGFFALWEILLFACFFDAGLPFCCSHGRSLLFGGAPKEWALAPRAAPPFPCEHLLPSSISIYTQAM